MDMDSVFLALGAAGAVLAMLLFVALNDAWIHGLLPLWRRWTYRGVDVSGGWKGLGNAAAPAPGEWTEVGLRFEQRTRELRGELWIRRCSAHRISQLQVPLSGSVSDGYVTLAASYGESTVAHAAALLKVDARGSCLTGQLLYQDAETGSVDGIHLSVYRASSMELPRLRPLPVHAGVASAA